MMQIPIKEIGSPSPILVIGKSRAFLKPLKRSWWDQILQRKPQYEIFIFSGKTIEDLPSQFPYPLPPPNLDPLARHRWRVEHGYSYVTKRCEEVLQEE